MFVCRIKRKHVVAHLVQQRALTGAEAVNALRPFYFAVHPDFFGQHPKERVSPSLLSAAALALVTKIRATNHFKDLSQTNSAFQRHLPALMF